MEKRDNTPCMLVILDGWGITQPTRGNAIAQAKKPFFDYLVSHYQTLALQASGEVVGLNWGEMGNSEVGHMTIGSGKTLFQSLTKINKSIISKNFFTNQSMLKMEKHVKENNSSLHLIGLVSDGGVHSHQDHLYAILDFCKTKKIHNVYIHAILDGRDTMKDDGIKYITALNKKLKDSKIGTIASLSGRFYAMDRDSHWDRTKLAYSAIAEGSSEKSYEDPITAIRESYKKEEFDEAFIPATITKSGEKSVQIQSNDAVIFFNFRADRARQLTSAFVLPGFEKFTRKQYHMNLFFATFTQYDKDFPVDVLFPPSAAKDSLSKIISDNNLKQLHAAETEKYAHVTFFFNGGTEEPQKNEDRFLVPSPLVQNYDQKPEMSAYELTNRMLKEISRDYYDFIVLNFANADMVGHTGNLDATIKAVQVIDECLEKIVSAIIEKNGVVCITADHGNAEQKLELQSGKIMKEHTKNPVPFVLVGKSWALPEQINENVDIYLANLTPSGMLSDIAPTILKILGLNKPQDMTGSSLF